MYEAGVRLLERARGVRGACRGFLGTWGPLRWWWRRGQHVLDCLEREGFAAVLFWGRRGALGREPRIVARGPRELLGVFGDAFGDAGEEGLFGC